MIKTSFPIGLGISEKQWSNLTRPISMKEIKTTNAYENRVYKPVETAARFIEQQLRGSKFSIGRDGFNHIYFTDDCGFAYIIIRVQQEWENPNYIESVIYTSRIEVYNETVVSLCIDSPSNKSKCKDIETILSRLRDWQYFKDTTSVLQKETLEKIFAGPVKVESPAGRPKRSIVDWLNGR